MNNLLIRHRKASRLIGWILVVDLLIFPWVSLHSPSAYAQETTQGQEETSVTPTPAAEPSAAPEPTVEPSGSVEPPADDVSPTPTPTISPTVEPTPAADSSSSASADESDSSADSSDHSQVAAAASADSGQADSQAQTDLTIDQQNQAAVDTNAQASAVSGLNTASSGDQSDTEIDTGDAAVTGEIVEEINSNVNTVDGTLEYIDVDDLEGDLVLLSDAGLSQASASAAPLTQQNQASSSAQVEEESDSASEESSSSSDGQEQSSVESLVTDVVNVAKIVTNVTVEAITGGNQANANQGSASITTGDASVFASLVQFANTTITADDVFFVIVNIFGELIGDIIFPSLFGAQVFSDPNSQLDLIPQSDNEILKAASDNQLIINEQVSLTADTGNNQAGGNECDSSIQTGDAQVKASLINIGNTNIVAINWGGLIVNDFGSWQGILIASSSSEFGTSNESGGSENGSLTVNTGNQADISRNVSLGAVSGLNQASNNQGNVAINTGSANASFSLVSFINTTINARRSLVAVVNIFGRMVGNLFLGASAPVEPDSIPADEPVGGSGLLDYVEDNSSTSLVLSGNNNEAVIYEDVIAVANTGGNVIGDPDLVIYKSHDAESGVVWPREKFAYYLAVENKGFSEAYNVVIEDTLPDKFIYEYDTSGLSLAITGQAYRWTVGTLWPGQKVEFWVHGQVVGDVVEGKYSMANSASVFTSTRESDTSNNTGDTALTLVAEPALYLSIWHNRGNGVYGGEQVTYWVKVENQGNGITQNRGILDTLPDGFVYVRDTTVRDGGFWSDPAGNNPFNWSFDALSPGESVLFSYTVNVSDSVEPGIYDNTVTVVGGPNGSEAASGVEVAVGVKVLGGVVLASIDQKGKVLGLPATGDDAVLLGLLGLLMIYLGVKEKEKVRRFKNCS